MEGSIVILGAFEGTEDGISDGLSEILPDGVSEGWSIMQKRKRNNGVSKV